MGKYLNVIIAIVILVIITAICSHYFYKKGQEKTWALAQQLVPLEKGEIYLCVERTDVEGVRFLTVQKIREATKDKNLDQRKLRYSLNMALIDQYKRPKIGQEEEIQ